MANDRTIPTAASAATVSGRAPRSAKVGESGRTGARADNSAALVLSSVGSNVECVTMWGVPAVIGSAPTFGGCAHVFLARATHDDNRGNGCRGPSRAARTDVVSHPRASGPMIRPP